jgi:D-beta-D-heptose 7-phosphate kinase/D-beta-D-heptose 1-phosphate adenosyltransferase
MIFYNLNDAARYINSFENQKIGITSGCYDLLHPLHVLYFEKCKRECDLLFVQIDSDMLTLRNKNKIPYINELDRAYMVDNLKQVHGSMIINDIGDIPTFLNMLNIIKNEIKNFKNSDTIYGKDAIQVLGVQLVIIPDISRFNSTTEIQNHLKQTK